MATNKDKPWKMRVSQFLLKYLKVSQTKVYFMGIICFILHDWLVMSRFSEKTTLLYDRNALPAKSYLCKCSTTYKAYV